MSEIARLRWLCRRGMKELDLLLNNYLEHTYPSAPDEDKQAFELILQMTDPELYDLVLGRSISDNTSVSRVIKNLHDVIT